MCEEFNDDNYLELESVDGKIIKCEIVKSFSIERNVYELLRILEPKVEVPGNDLILMKYVVEDGDICLSMVDDEEEVEKVHQFLTKMMEAE